ncbi:hypothetical protein ABZ820_34845 [Streptomyces diacarni]|uniref:hypothetical protein n=1 Tax=Streptomyces diacarni TaxID=2800381 RepID=UPI0033C26BF1
MSETPMTPERVAEIAARVDAATPGPWRVDDDWAEIKAPDLDTIADYWEPTRESGNGAFIANAREDVPALLAEVERLRAELAARPTRAEVLRAEAAWLREIATPITRERSEHERGQMYAAERMAQRADAAGKDTREGESTLPTCPVCTNPPCHCRCFGKQPRRDCPHQAATADESATRLRAFLAPTDGGDAV